MYFAVCSVAMRFEGLVMMLIVCSECALRTSIVSYDVAVLRCVSNAH